MSGLGRARAGLRSAEGRGRGGRTSVEALATFARCTALASLAALGASIAACGEAPSTRDPFRVRPRITAVEAAAPVLEGTVLRVTGMSLDRVGRTPSLHVEAFGTDLVLTALPHTVRGEHLFEVSPEVVAVLGDGDADVTLTLDGQGTRSEAFRDRWTVATALGLTVDAAPSGEVHRNEVAVLRGDGFVSATEGDTQAHFVGTFTRLVGGATSAVDARLPVLPAERTGRDRGLVVLTTDLGGLSPGTFSGTMQVDSTLRSGARRQSAAQACTVRFAGPELYSVSPAMASVGSVLTVRGAGFLGGADRPTETTLLRLEGTFTARDGAASAFGPAELVPRFVSGDTVELVLDAEARGGALVARIFGAARGALAGMATPIVIAGRDELEGAPVPFRFVLGPVRQVVALRFLDGFYDTLDRFGLSSAAGTIEPAIVRRIEDIYAGYEVDVRLETPTDFDATAFAVLEVGGPDPNGNGLFGFDNSAGKDVGNLRLFDQIGGANAETQMDGFPGFGGVFVESMLWWSSHPDLPVPRPPSSPEPEPLFDALFDAVRAEPATLAELSGEGAASRVEVVRRAFDALASIVGETAAHELGHSLGMAQPYGAPTAFHNDLDEDGCLMDRGGDRPLGERAQQPGFARSHLCYDEPEYMAEILGP